MNKINFFFKATDWIIFGVIGFRIVELVFNVYTVIEIKNSIAGNKNVDSLEFIDRILGIEDTITSIMTASLAIFFLGWFYLSYKKAQQNRNLSFSYKPVLSLFSFIIPIFNLFAPYKIMHEIWTAENRNPSQEQSGKRLINIWWLLSIIIFIYSRYCRYKFKNIEELDEFVTAEYYYIIYYAVSIHYLLTLKNLLKMINFEQNYNEPKSDRSQPL